MGKDAILIVSFGGPEKYEDVMPFLDRVLEGKRVPEARKREVAEHYYHFGGRSPINGHNRQLIAALRALLTERGPQLPVYWGNRNWRPFLADAFRDMAADGVTRAYAFVTSAFGSYSGCRQYLENLQRAREEARAEVEVLKLRLFYNHPHFVNAMAGRVQEALSAVPEEGRAAAHLIFTAHSIPISMAHASPYASQLREACRLVTEALGRTDFSLAYQSRSGPPQQPWLVPDVLDRLREIAAGGGSRDVVVAPIGFLSDHMEVLYDLDIEAAETARALGLKLLRAGTVGLHPLVPEMIRELVLERRELWADRAAVGCFPAGPDVCAAGCCAMPGR